MLRIGGESVGVVVGHGGTPGTAEISFGDVEPSTDAWTYYYVGICDRRLEEPRHDHVMRIRYSILDAGETRGIIAEVFDRLTEGGQDFKMGEMISQQLGHVLVPGSCWANHRETGGRSKELERPLASLALKTVVGYSVDPDHNSKGVLRFFLKNPFWETLEKRVSTETYKGVLSSSVLGPKGKLELKQKQDGRDPVPIYR
ncbi:hypothetical protein B0H14DRAFT_3128942 [Mycena olivaceomarginata]|nr:hypothetical protein B0H14DRAFT_3128942 [Mycena olivaceomarginata]